MSAGVVITIYDFISPWFCIKIDQLSRSSWAICIDTNELRSAFSATRGTANANVNYFIQRASCVGAAIRHSVSASLFAACLQAIVRGLIVVPIHWPIIMVLPFRALHMAIQSFMRNHYDNKRLGCYCRPILFYIEEILLAKLACHADVGWMECKPKQLATRYEDAGMLCADMTAKSMLSDQAMQRSMDVADASQQQLMVPACDLNLMNGEQFVGLIDDSES